MRHSGRRTAGALVASVVALCVGLTGCTLSDSYPRATSAGDLTGSWMHGSARLVLAGDGTFVMTHMPKYVVQADSGESRTPTLTCSGTWSFDQTVQNLTLSPTKPSSAECRGDELSVAGRNNERTIAFGIDSGSGNPLCFELLRPGSNLTAQGIDECQTY